MKKRLLLIESGKCVGEILIEAMKNQCMDFEIHPITTTDPGGIQQEFIKFNPDIVVFDDSSPKEILDLLMNLSFKNPSFKLVEICADTNGVQVHYTQQIEIKHTEDFIKILEC